MIGLRLTVLSRVAEVLECASAARRFYGEVRIAMECHQCQRWIRWDEALWPAAVGAGTLYLCPRCYAENVEQEPPPIKSYPRNTRVPQHPLRDCGAHMPICGLCRQALLWGQERGEYIRLYPELIDAETRERYPDVKSISYPMCNECVVEWRPKVVAYLKRLCRTCNELDCVLSNHVPFIVPEADEMLAAPDLLY